MPCIIYFDTESLIKKIDACANNPENLSTTKIGEYIPCRYSMSVMQAFESTENKHTLHRGEDCVKKFCEFLREHVKNITDLEKKRMLSLTKEEIKSYQDAKECCICGKIILKKFANDKNIKKLGTIVISEVNIEVQRIVFVI